MKELHKFLKAFIFVQLGACFGRVLVKYIDYVKYPELYTVQSAPWYTSIMLTVALTVITVSITTAAYFLVGNRIKKRKQKQIDNNK